MAPAHHYESLRKNKTLYMVDWDRNYGYAWKIEIFHTEKILDFVLLNNGGKSFSRYKKLGEQTP